MKFQRDNLFSRTDTVVSTDLALVVALKGAESSALPVTFTPAAGPTTATVSRVAANAASVTLLAANAARNGATICNNSNQTLYVKLGTTANIGAGTESFTAILAPKDTNNVGGYYEVPFGYSGRIDGIWAAADAAGEALMTEITP